MRPEFLRRHAHPLSSDCFSRFGKGPESLVNNQEAREATERLEAETIPQFAQHLDRLRQKYETNNSKTLNKHGVSIDSKSAGFNLSALQQELSGNTSMQQALSQFIADVHLHGINVRYLIQLLNSVQIQYNRQLIGTELVARTIKNLIRDQWRSAQKLIYCFDDSSSSNLPPHLAQAIRSLPISIHDDQPFRLVVVHVYNVVFGRSDQSKDWWTHQLPQLIRSSGYPTEQIPSACVETLLQNLKDFIQTIPLFHRCSTLLGISFSQISNFHCLFSFSPSSSFPSFSTDL